MEKKREQSIGKMSGVPDPKGRFQSSSQARFTKPNPTTSALKLKSKASIAKIPGPQALEVYSEPQQTLFNAGPHTVEVNVKIKKTPTSKSKQPMSAHPLPIPFTINNNLRRGKIQVLIHLTFIIHYSTTNLLLIHNYIFQPCFQVHGPTF